MIALLPNLLPALTPGFVLGFAAGAAMSAAVAMFMHRASLRRPRARLDHWVRVYPPFNRDGDSLRIGIEIHNTWGVDVHVSELHVKLRQRGADTDPADWRTPAQVLAERFERPQVIWPGDVYDFYFSTSLKKDTTHFIVESFATAEGSGASKRRRRWSHASFHEVKDAEFERGQRIRSARLTGWIKR